MHYVQHNRISLLLFPGQRS